MAYRILLGACLYLALCFFIGPSFFIYLADGFSPQHIASNLEESSVNESMSSEIKEILDQNFSYLGKGSQCFVFKSHDDRFVLKFFRNNRLRPNFLYRCFAKTSWGKKRIASKIAKRTRLRTSCQIARDYLQEETKLIHVHLYKTPNAYSTICAIDRLGRTYMIDLNSVEFILQEKVEPMQVFLKKNCKAKETELIHSSFNNLITLLRIRSHKGIYDSDAAIATNIGFTSSGQAVIMDIGQFQLDKKMQELNAEMFELFKMTAKFYNKLKLQEPELADYFEAEVMKLLDAYLIYSRLPYPFSPTLSLKAPAEMLKPLQRVDG